MTTKTIVKKKTKTVKFVELIHDAGGNRSQSELTVFAKSIECLLQNDFKLVGAKKHTNNGSSKIDHFASFENNEVDTQCCDLLVYADDSEAYIQLMNMISNASCVFVDQNGKRETDQHGDYISVFFNSLSTPKWLNKYVTNPFKIKKKLFPNSKNMFGFEVEFNPKAKQIFSPQFLD